jgi:alkanesulfonate monooxygenase SsuD/methylene tetrahydromethanopterin reductase-like flavin-dependent oxidoreductase (luciferase family)
VQLGLFMNSWHLPETVAADAYDVDLDLIVRAEALGYEEALFAEHFTSLWAKLPTPDLLIAAALQRTTRLRLGTGVNCLPYHHPAMLAHRIATLDHLARGRLIWGIGAGGLPGDMELFQVDLEGGEHRRLWPQVVDAVLRIWERARDGASAGETWDTPHWKLKLPGRVDGLFGLHIAPYQHPHPPIAVAGLTPRSETLVVAGERGWIPMSIGIVPAATVASHWECYAEAAARAGRTPQRKEWRIVREVHVAETTAQARREALEGGLANVWSNYILKILPLFDALKLVKTDPDMPDEALTLEWLLDNIWIVGSPDDVARQLRELYQRVGGFGTLHHIPYNWGARQDQNLRSMELLAREVMPQLADLQ